MQLKKQSIRNTPDFNERNCQHGIKRQAHSFNQKRNQQQRNRNKFGDTFK